MQRIEIFFLSMSGWAKLWILNHMKDKCSVPLKNRDHYPLKKEQTRQPASLLWKTYSRYYISGGLPRIVSYWSLWTLNSASGCRAEGTARYVCTPNAIGVTALFSDSVHLLVHIYTLPHSLIRVQAWRMLTSAFLSRQYPVYIIKSNEQQNLSSNQQLNN